MEIHLRVKTVIASLGVAKSSVSDVTNAGRIVAPSPEPGVNEKGAFAMGPLGGVRTVYIALCLLLPVIAALAYWRLNSLSGSNAADQPVGETAIARPDGSTRRPSYSRLCDTICRWSQRLVDQSASRATIRSLQAHS